jgi:serine/threonine protein kinase
MHHHIVQVLDFGRIDDAYFLAMEYVDGITLRELMRRADAQGARIPGDVCVFIGDGILAGLGFAHEDARDSDGARLRVVHRDLAPANVLVSKAGAVKITDFGIARALRDAASTVTGVVGHAGHMAPEQVEGAAFDERADLFCAGIILWELVCGRSLFDRPSDAASLRAISLAEVPAPSSIDPQLAPWDRFLLRALARQPADRFQSAREMAAALNDVAANVGRANEDALARLIASLRPADEPLPVRGIFGTPSETETLVETR